MAKPSSGHSVAPLLIVMLVAVVAVSGMFVMGSGVSWVGEGVTGAQALERETAVDSSDDTATLTVYGEVTPDVVFRDETSPTYYVQDKISSTFDVQDETSSDAESKGDAQYCGHPSYLGDCNPYGGCTQGLQKNIAHYVKYCKLFEGHSPRIRTPSNAEFTYYIGECCDTGDQPECESDQEEVSTTGNALALSGKGRVNWLILGTALLAVVLLGVLVKSGPAKSKKAKKTRALLLAGILVLAVIAGGLVLLKPATKGWATAEECSECAGYNEAVDAANNAMLEVWKNMDERVALSTFFSNYNSALDDSIINDDSISMPCKQGLMAFQNIAVQSMTSPSLTSSIEFYNEKAYALQSKLDKLPPRGKCRGEEDLKAMQSLAEELRALAAQIPDTDVHSQRRSNFDNAVSNWLDKCNDLNSQDEATINTLIREVG